MNPHRSRRPREPLGRKLGLPSKIHLQALGATLGLWLGLTLLGAASAASATLEIQASVATLELADEVEITVVVSGLGAAAAPSVGTFDVQLSYDAALFTPAEQTTVFGSRLGDTGAGEALTEVAADASQVEVFELSLQASEVLNSSQPTSFELFSTRFTAIALGQGSFGLTVPALGDANGESLTIDPIMPVEIATIPGVFADGFESGDVDVWSQTVGGSP